MTYKLLSEINKPEEEAVEQETVEEAVVEYNLITQLNESAHDEEEYSALIEKAIEVLGFNPDEVIHTDDDAEELMKALETRPLEEQGGERAAAARAGEQDWLRGLAGREERGAEYGGSKLGLTAGKEPPKAEDRVLFGRVPTRITDIDRQGGDITAVSVPVGKVELIVPRKALVGPKILGNERIWMVSKEHADQLIRQWKERQTR